jgi:hypothetical protein
VESFAYNDKTPHFGETQLPIANWTVVLLVCIGGGLSGRLRPKSFENPADLEEASWLRDDGKINRFGGWDFLISKRKLQT